MENFPTDLPELSKPKLSRSNCRKTQKNRDEHFENKSNKLTSTVKFVFSLLIRGAINAVTLFFCFLIVYRILESKTKDTVYSSFLSLTVEKTISYYYLLSLLVPIISYYSFFGGTVYGPKPRH